MSLSSQDQFEQAYSEDNGGMPVAFIKLQRLGDSYEVPKIARAWYWWKRARAGVVVELPFNDPELIDDYHQQGLLIAKKAIEAAGVAVAP